MRGQYVRKTVTQLPSKMRFVAAQFNALLDDDLWLELAGHSNRMATELAHGDVGDLPASSWAAAGRQQRVPDASPGGDRAVAGLELLLGLGPIPPSGALDDRLGHRSGRHRTFATGVRQILAGTD